MQIDFLVIEVKAAIAYVKPRCYNARCAGESSSGRTADSGSASEGSNPSSPAKQIGVKLWRISQQALADFINGDGK